MFESSFDIEYRTQKDGAVKKQLEVVLARSTKRTTINMITAHEEPEFIIGRSEKTSQS